MATALLVRHGETDWNRAGRVQGWTDTELTDRGREQARATGDYLAGAYDVDALVTSDLRRASETAALLDTDDPRTGRPGLADPHIERGWRERHFGDHQGTTKSAIAEARPDYDPDGSLLAVDAVPGGETLDEFVRRVTAAWESLLAGLDGDETAVVVTHGGPIRTVVADVTGRDVPALAREWSPDNCCVTEVDVSGSPSLVRRDDCSHLA